MAGLQVVRGEPERRRRLHEEGDWLRGALRSAGWRVGESRGPIVPVIVGSPARAVALSGGVEVAGISGAGDPAADGTQGYEPVADQFVGCAYQGKCGGTCAGDGAGDGWLEGLAVSCSPR